MAATMATPELEGNRLSGLFQRLLQGLCEGRRAVGTAFPPVAPSERPVERLCDQLFSSGVMCLENSSKEVSPLSISPLMKKVGVELTFKTSLAYFWSAAILSSSA